MSEDETVDFFAISFFQLSKKARSEVIKKLIDNFDNEEIDAALQQLDAKIVVKNEDVESTL